MAPPVESSSAYEELPILIVRLKLAAIDAYMREDGWTLEDERYHRQIYRSFLSVSRPHENGQGGVITEVLIGMGTNRPVSPPCSATVAFVQERVDRWNTIRSEIDTVLSAWVDLPNPQRLEAYYGQDAHDAAIALAVGDSDLGGGSSPAAGDLDDVADLCTTALRGLTFRAFSANFLRNVRRAINGSCALVVVLDQAVNGEVELWNRARLNTAEIVERATQSFRNYAGWSHDETIVALKVLGAVIAGAAAVGTAVATGGLTIALAGATGGAMVTLLSEVYSGSIKAEEQRNLAGGSYRDIWKAFDAALNALNEQIKAEETTLQANLNGNHANATRDSGFDIPKDKVVTGGTDTTQLLGVTKVTDLGADVKTDPEKVAAITKVYLPHVADELENAQRILMRRIIPDNLPWVRHYSIGIGEKGPWPVWNQLAWTIWSLLGDLAWECRENAKVLDIIDQRLHTTDTESAKRLDALLLQTAEANASGNKYDPFGRD